MQQLQEIKSHSPVSFNERLAILFYFIDKKSDDIIQSCEKKDYESIKIDVAKIKIYVKHLSENVGVLIKLKGHK